MLNLIKNLLLNTIDNIDAGNCLLSLEKLFKLMNLLIDMNNEPVQDLIMSKQAAADYLGISRATFDNRVHDGLIPQGHKYGGLKELIWFKFELDLANSKE